MAEIPIELSAVVRNRAIAEGEADWIERLPEIVAGLGHDWGFTVGRRFNEGTEAFVAEVHRSDGSPAILKVLVPGRDGRPDDNEATVLRLADGNGCPVLYRDDPRSSAPSAGALLTTTNVRSSSMATSSSGMCSRPGTASNSSTPTGCSPRPSTTSV